MRLLDYSNLERLLAAHIYVTSAKGQVPFHPVSMYLLRVYRRERNLSCHETLRILKSEDGHELRRFDLLYQAGFLPTRPDHEEKVSLTFDGMLHEARSRMRCAHVTESCYQPVPRPCPAKEKGKQGCDCAAPSLSQTRCAKRPLKPPATPHNPYHRDLYHYICHPHHHNPLPLSLLIP